MTEKDKWVTATPDQLYDMATVLINGRDKRIAALEKKVEQLREALQALYDEQNGPPLIRDAARWEAAMELARKALEEK